MRQARISVSALGLLGVATVAAMIAGLVLALVVAPADAVQGDAQRVMYVHVPSAWLAYLSFAVTAIASVLVLIRRRDHRKWDLLAGASAEVGLVFTALTLVTGSIWGRPIWGTWWEWDARLTTTAVLFFLFLGYLSIRRIGGDTGSRSRRNAIVALVAFVDVPIVHFSVNWWQTLHQEATVFTPDLDPQIGGTMAFTLLWSVIAFTLLYGLLVGLRYRIAELDEARVDGDLARAIQERISTASPALAGVD